MPDGGIDNKVRLVFGFAEADALLFHEFERHLAALRNSGVIHVWHVGEVMPGEDRRSEITRHFAEAHLVVLILSADFVSSPECYELLLSLAAEKTKSPRSRLVLLLVRPVDLSGTPLAGLKMLPENGQPISQWTDRDEAWMEIAKCLRQMISEMSSEAEGAQPWRPSCQKRAREIYLRARGFLLVLASIVTIAVGAGVVRQTIRSDSISEERQAVAESIARDSMIVDKRLNSMMTTFESFLKDAPSQSDMLAAAQLDLKRAIDEQYRAFDEHAWFWYSGLPSKAARLQLPQKDLKKIYDSAQEYRQNLIDSMRSIDPSWGLLLSRGLILRAPYTIATVDESRATLNILTAQRGTIAQCLRQTFLGANAR
jgi:hypothetical protein